MRFTPRNPLPSSILPHLPAFRLKKSAFSERQWHSATCPVNRNDIMKTIVPVKKQAVAAKGQTPDVQRRINAGWLRLWRTVYPHTPPPAEVQSLKSKVQSPACGVQSPKSKVRSPEDRRPAAVERLASFLSFWLALGLLVAGCASTRPLKGGKAVTTRKPAGAIEQKLMQGENPAQATKQTQETVKVRTYTVPASSRLEQSQMPPAQPSTINSQPINSPPSTLDPKDR